MLEAYLPEPELQVKTSAGWRNDDGSVIAPHELRRYACACGWVGPWYARDENARRSYDRHAVKHDEEARADGAR